MNIGPASTFDRDRPASPAAAKLSSRKFRFAGCFLCATAFALIAPLTNAAEPLISDNFNAADAGTGAQNFKDHYQLQLSMGNQQKYGFHAGVGKTGGVLLPTGREVYAINKQSVGAWPDAKKGFLVSLDVKLQNTQPKHEDGTFSILFFLGFTTGKEVDLRSGDSEALRMSIIWNEKPQDPGYRIFLGPPDTFLGKIAFDELPDGHWLRWVLRFEFDRRGKEVNLQASVYDLGADGTAEPSDAIKSFSQPDIYVPYVVRNAPQLYFGVQGRSRDAIGVFSYDNLEVSHLR
ncbi:MAG: hypothetical protein AAGK14_04755 [Verrucomicrobiota bacterium]